MKVIFFDRQEASNPHNNEVVDGTTELLDILESLRDRNPFFCELVGDDGFNLLLGIGGDRSCAQYSAGDGNTPYLMARLERNTEADGYEEFLINDTITPVPNRYSIPFETAKEVATHFLKTGQRSPLVLWEEI